MNSDLRILLLIKKNNPFADKVSEYVRLHFPNAEIYTGSRKDIIPDGVLNWQGDVLISFISQWIIPDAVLKRARIAAINFHPGSPDYPGIGCTNFAIYNGEKEYGATCHHMDATIDTGNIIAVKRFPIIENDTVYSVTQNCYQKLYELFLEIASLLIEEKQLPQSNEKWTRTAYTRKDLTALCKITPDMSEEEIERRIKATTYEKKWAFTQIGKYIFKL